MLRRDVFELMESRRAGSHIAYRPASLVSVPAAAALPTAPAATTAPAAVNTDPYIPLGSQSDGGVLPAVQGFRVPFSIPKWAWWALAIAAAVVLWRRFSHKGGKGKRGKK